MSLVLGFVFDRNDHLRVNGLPNPIGEFDGDVVKKMNIEHARGYIANVDSIQQVVAHSGFLILILTWTGLREVYRCYKTLVGSYIRL